VRFRIRSCLYLTSRDERQNREKIQLGLARIEILFDLG
jgi:hypothetical protein